MNAAATPAPRHVAVIGGGPAGLMAAEAARAAGAEVTLYEQMPSVARKFLIAGKGGLNLTHSEPFDRFVSRYGARAPQVRPWLEDFGADALRRWAAELGYPTVVGSSGRVFPSDFKAGPLLRAWVRRLRAQGVQLHCGWRWTGWHDDGRLQFAVAESEHLVAADAVVLALGGASWSALGADGRWAATLAGAGVELAPFAPSNCGFECEWSEHFRQRHAGAPIKSVALQVAGADQTKLVSKGEFVLTDYGVEGSAIYVLSAPLRDAIAHAGSVALSVDLAPDRSHASLLQSLQRPRGKRSLSEFLRRQTGLDGAKLALLYECTKRSALEQPDACAQAIKSLTITLQRTRPLDEAISTAGGVPLEALNADLSLRSRPTVFCAGEMLDWEAPTGGYLLTACMASGQRAGIAAARSC